jgi:hypothetical protein
MANQNLEVVNRNLEVQNNKPMSLLVQESLCALYQWLSQKQDTI